MKSRTASRAFDAVSAERYVASKTAIVPFADGIALPSMGKAPLAIVLLRGQYSLAAASGTPRNEKEAADEAHYLVHHRRNVNGIRNPFGYQPWNAARTFPAMFDILGSDIVVMQELKIQRKDLRDDMVMIDGWDCYFSLPRHKKGYSGVGVYTRNATCAPIKAEEGLLGVLPSALGQPYCELPEAQRIGGYPSEQQKDGACNGMRDDFRYGFICALDCRIRNLVAAGKRVVLVGDLNVSRDELDSAGAAEDMKKMGITHEEYISTPNRRIFNQLIVEGEVIGKRDSGRERGVLWDTTRAFHPERKGMYTHWEQKINARPGNFGSRIDFVLVQIIVLFLSTSGTMYKGVESARHSCFLCQALA
ncbi:APN2 DNA lyase apurinic/apyrimidinic [Hortaea werneckii]|nr:APN2 DNA lyase apurinic/apyrimidinic [Hortaea werneckii]